MTKGYRTLLKNTKTYILVFILNNKEVGLIFSLTGGRDGMFCSSGQCAPPLHSPQNLILIIGLRSIYDNFDGNCYENRLKKSISQVTFTSHDSNWWPSCLARHLKHKWQNCIDRWNMRAFLVEVRLPDSFHLISPLGNFF